MFVPPAGATQGAGPTARWSFFRPIRDGAYVWMHWFTRGPLSLRLVFSTLIPPGVGGWGSAASAVRRRPSLALACRVRCCFALSRSGRGALAFSALVQLLRTNIMTSTS